jgi:hypothetical protein
MRKLFYQFLIPAFASVALLSSCGSDKDDDISVDNNDTTVYTGASLTMNETSSDFNVDVTVSADQGTVNARITFTDANDDMKRMYFTQNVGGAGAEPYEISAEVDKKGDGSIDIPGDKGDTLVYDIELDVPSGISSGTVVYTVWATDGKGDYRDASKNKVVGIGTITLNYGGENAASIVKEYSMKILAAPLADGSSNSFVSLYNGEVYKIKDGEEYAAYWDFGYFYTTNASFASTSMYDEAFNALDPKINTYSSELNECFFALSSLTEAEFDAIGTSGDLNTIEKSESQEINNLEVGDIIEFVDNYGKKGLIKVIEFTEGYGSDDYIKIDIKVQP